MILTGDAARPVIIIKWTASLAQIAAYGATALGATPFNLYCLFIGVAGWLIVGIMWRDRAITISHIIALAAMIAGSVVR